ncbi:unnamed protein product, partial [Strongylus vulgaris]
MELVGLYINFPSYSRMHLKRAIEFYHPDAVLIETGKKGTYGKEAIKKEFLDFDNQVGKSITKVVDEHYQMTEDYIFFWGHHETKTEKGGVLKAEFHQIWKKCDGKYLILRDEYSK